METQSELEKEFDSLMGRLISHGYNDAKSGMWKPSEECEAYFKEERANLKKLISAAELRINAKCNARAEEKIRNLMEVIDDLKRIPPKDK